MSVKRGVPELDELRDAVGHADDLGKSDPALGIHVGSCRAGGISARRIAGWRVRIDRVRIDLVGALELSVHLAAGSSRFGVTCLRLVL